MSLAVNWFIKLPIYSTVPFHTGKKENEICLIYQEIQEGAVAKSYVGKGFLITSVRNCANIKPCMRRPLVILTLQLLPSEFPHILYEENLIFFFISVPQNYLLHYMYCTPLDCVYPVFFIADSLSRISARHSTYFAILQLFFLLTGWMNLLFNF